MTTPTRCLVPGCLRKDAKATEYRHGIGGLPLCGGHLRLWEDMVPEGVVASSVSPQFHTWAQEQAASEAVRTPLHRPELVRIGSQPVEGGNVTLYAEVTPCVRCGDDLTTGELTVGGGICLRCADSEIENPAAGPMPHEVVPHANGVSHG